MIAHRRAGVLGHDFALSSRRRQVEASLAQADPNFLITLRSAQCLGPARGHPPEATAGLLAVRVRDGRRINEGDAPAEALQAC